MSSSVVDWATLEENFDNDKFAISLVVDAFVQAAPEGMLKLKSALEAKSNKEVAMAAHSIKGAILNFGAAEAVRLSQALENKGYEGLTSDVDSLFSELEAAVAILLAELLAESARYQEAG